MYRARALTLVLILLVVPMTRSSAQNDTERPMPALGDDETVMIIVEEVTRLRGEVDQLRRQLADAQLRAAQATNERDELRQFIADHDQFGADFARYRAVRELAERDARRREAEANRERRDQRRADQRERQRVAREQRDRDRAEADWENRYRKAGFGSLGLDVFASRMAFSYHTRETNPTRVDYDPFIGLYFRPGGPSVEIDYGRMTISGSVLNANRDVRNIGVAITFFDENGNQVGGEIVRINNARPDVPYPFTSTIEMALDRPFSTSSTYVLYADPIPE
ncbi:MAG: hypothetical protein GY715_03610 [Planctomycetes bacterium]|nr:hypothetical protein [Planctomycetota bacterium]